MNKPRLCGYCAAAPASSLKSLSHRLCPGGNCACYDNNHVVTEEIAAIQRIYVGAAEPYHAKERNQST